MTIDTSQSFEAEGARILAEIKAMSRENSTSKTQWIMRVQYAPLADVDELEFDLPWFASIPKRGPLVEGIELARALWRRFGASESEIAEAVHWNGRHTDYAASMGRRTRPLYDGTRPADLTDRDIREAATWEPEYRNRARMPDQRALVNREWHLDRGRADGYAAGVRETHPPVCRALAGETYDQRLDRLRAEHLGLATTDETRTEATVGPTITGCPWCAEAGR